MEKSPVKLIIVGCSSSARNLLSNNLLGDEVEIVGIYDANPILLTNVANDLGLNRIDHFEDISKYDFDGVAIMTPSDSHFSLCQYFLEMDKYVFCESPIARSQDQLKIIGELGQEKLDKIYTYTPYSGLEAFQKLKDMIRTKQIGKSYLVKILLSNETPSIYHGSESILTEFGPSLMYITKLFGDINEHSLFLKNVKCSSGVEDFAYGHFDLSNDTLIHFELDSKKEKRASTVEVLTDKCTVVIKPTKNTIKVSHEKGQDEKINFDSRHSPLEKEFLNFVTTVRNKNSCAPLIDQDIFSLPNLYRTAS
ncbi:Gfo/Idh/MocA family protein [Bacteriovorax sp. Seq25_V]|uniref:Gfo/Idh/MocA family protein n=1 Tax=Bacteriovorax sp. Seq25_V TaxID=1201288 RepID=UPI00038A0130|nr:Gfo/Idh/MocA family oxidoreductase [Bacteriovorax sp. Seq25_V]EQC47345.1 oxidoreductase, NAD-binding domain protein [Bacteriovorax sp. Seq25_V]